MVGVTVSEMPVSKRYMSDGWFDASHSQLPILSAGYSEPPDFSLALRRALTLTRNHLWMQLLCTHSAARQPQLIVLRRTVAGNRLLILACSYLSRRHCMLVQRPFDVLIANRMRDFGLVGRRMVAS